MIAIILDALRRYRLRRNIAKLRAIFVRNQRSEGIAACDALQAKLDAGEV